MKIFLLADVYENSNLSNAHIQEWESLESIQVMKKTLEELGHEVLIREPLKDKNIFLTELLEIEPTKKENTLIWNLVEGFFSRNREGYVPAMAEFLGFPFTGSDAYAQVLSLDKFLTKKISRELSIPTANSQLWTESTQSPLPFPFFVKPNGEGSSLGITQNNFIQSSEEWNRFQKDLDPKILPLLMEEVLPGKEFTVGILGSSEDLCPTRAAEIIYPGNVYGSEIKTKSEMPETLIPLEDSRKESFLQEASLRLAKRMGVTGFARLDWKEDEEGNPHFLEINLTPGLSIFYSSLPICARFSGISYSELLAKIVHFARIDYHLPAREYGKK